MTKKIKYTIAGTLVAAIVVTGAVGIWYGTTYPTYNINSINVTGGDATLTGTNHIAGSEINKFVANVDGTSKHGGTPNVSWDLLYISGQGSVPTWITIKSDADLQSHIEWTDNAVAGSYVFLVRVNTIYHSLFITTLTIS